MRFTSIFVLCLLFALQRPAFAAVRWTGTAFAVAFDGTLVTNHHVVAGCTSLWARLSEDPRFYEAKILGYDQSSDLAAIKISRRVGQRELPIVRALLRRTP